MLKNGAVIQSGNVVEFRNGSIRRVIGVTGGKFLFLDDNDRADVESFGLDYFNYFNNIVRVYEGLAGRCDITGWSDYKHTTVLWKKSNSVRLNDEYTATIEGDVVVVGCQRIPLEKVRELVKLAD